MSLVTIQEVMARALAHHVWDTDGLAAFIAIRVRNAMEDFHAGDGKFKVEGLDDEAMGRLNPVIRRAIYEALRDVLGEEDINGMTREQRISFPLACIPSYWEQASKLPPIDG